MVLHDREPSIDDFDWIFKIVFIMIAVLKIRSFLTVAKLPKFCQAIISCAKVNLSVNICYVHIKKPYQNNCY